MSDLISREALFKRLAKWNTNDATDKSLFNFAMSRIIEQPTVEVPQWIPCSERLPSERESMFKKFKGTDKWDNAMFDGISEDVNVTVEFEDGTRKTKVSHTLDGKWKCEKEYGIKMKVIAWMPLPEPYKG